MKIIRLSLFAVALLMLGLTACSPDDPSNITLDQPSGEEALANYVALGNSLTAGFMDGGLIMNGQAASFPAQIAGAIGAHDFVQPMVASPGVGSSTPSSPANAAGVLHWDGSAITLLGETPLVDIQSLLLAALNPTPYQNLGVPGATTYDVSNALTSANSQSPGNSFFDFILRNPTFGNKTMLEQTIAQGPTLVTLWIGNNDVLGGATGGDPVLGTNVTPPATFNAMLDGIVTALNDGIFDRFGYTPALVVGNIPSITSVPYFVPKAVFDTVVGFEYPTDEADVAYVRFPALGIADGTPLASTYTLTSAEVTVVEDAVEGFNDAIDALAATHGFTVVDMNTVLADLDATSRTHFQLLVGQGMTVEAAAAATAFSLDGIHPNSRGYSIAANAFIDGINTALELTGDAAVDQVSEASWDPTYGTSNKGAVVHEPLKGLF